MVSNPGTVTEDATVSTEMVASSPPAVRDLSLAARALVSDVLPQTAEVVCPHQ